jgi:hypothetical protein
MMLKNLEALEQQVAILRTRYAESNNVAELGKILATLGGVGDDHAVFSDVREQETKRQSRDKVRADSLDFSA